MILHSEKGKDWEREEKLIFSATQCKQADIKIISARDKCSGVNQTGNGQESEWRRMGKGSGWRGRDGHPAGGRGF